jgi:hypothetical protein
MGYTDEGKGYRWRRPVLIKYISGAMHTIIFE